jgi:hypothetical protein
MGHLQRDPRPSQEITNNHFSDSETSHRNPADENVGCGNFRRFVAPLPCCLWRLQLDYGASV